MRTCGFSRRLRWQPIRACGQRGAYRRWLFPGYIFDYDRAAAFLISPGQVAMIDKGVCHAAFMIGPKCTYLNMTRKDPWEGTNPDDEGRIDVIQKSRTYVDVIQLEKRDQRVLELDMSKVLGLIPGQVLTTRINADSP